MSDSGFSASELRKRYAAGGSNADDSLSASQLRARHAISGNNPDWATTAPQGGLPGNVVVCLIVSAALGLGALAYFSFA